MKIKIKVSLMRKYLTIIVFSMKLKKITEILIAIQLLVKLDIQKSLKQIQKKDFNLLINLKENSKIYLIIFINIQHPKIDSKD